MSRTLRFCLFALLGGALASCAGHTLRIESFPEGAEVAYRMGETNRTPLGVTPLTIRSDEHPGLFQGAAVLEITKAKYVSETLVVPAPSMKTAGRVAVRLQEQRLGNSCSVEAAALLAKGIAQAQGDIASKRYLEAENTLKNLLVKFPEVAVLYDLLGNLYYLRREVDKALSAYQRSAELEPGNPYTDRLIRKLSTINGDGGRQ